MYCVNCFDCHESWLKEKYTKKVKRMLKFLHTQFLMSWDDSFMHAMFANTERIKGSPFTKLASEANTPIDKFLTYFNENLMYVCQHIDIWIN